MRAILHAVVLVAAVSSRSLAQGPTPWALSALAGPSSYDLSGTGTTFAAALHVSWQWRPALIVEPGITYFSYASQLGSRTTFLFPEVSLQAAVPRGPVRPYLGVGAGRSVVLHEPGDHLSLHATLGLRIPVGRTWGLRSELRVRSPHQWGAVTADYMFGLSRRLDLRRASAGGK